MLPKPSVLRPERKFNLLNSRSTRSKKENLQNYHLLYIHQLILYNR